jgi:PAS domain S-box-containing protein
MSDLNNKTKTQLIAELEALRHRVAELESAEARSQQVVTALRENEILRRLANESLHEGIWVVDRDSYTVHVNSCMAAMLGYTVEEMLGRHLFSFMDEQSVKMCKRLLERRRQGISEQHDFEFLRKDGTRIYTLLEAIPIMDEAGNYAGAMAGVIDITERRRAEEALKESEWRNKIISELTTDYIFVVDVEPGGTLRLRWASDSMQRLTGRTIEDAATAEMWKSIIHPDDMARFFDFVNQVATTAYTGELECRTFTGWDEERWIRVVAQPQIGEGSVVTTIVGAIQDITARKRAEEGLRRSEASLRKAQQVSHVGSWKWNIKTNQLEWSDEMYHIFGIEKEDFSGSLEEVIAQAIHPDDRFEVERSNLSVIREKKPIPLEYRVIRPDQSIRTVWAEAGELMVDEAGNPVLLTGIVQDITERKQAEEALRESEERYRELFNRISSGVAVYEAVGNGEDFVFKDFNQAGARIEQVNQDEVIERRVAEVFPGVRDMGLLEVFRRVWRTGQPEHHPVSFYKDERHIGWRENYIYKLPSGEIVAVYDDVTVRKQAEEALRESEEKFRTFIEQASDGITLFDEQGNFIEWNRACEKITGLKREEVIGQPYWDVQFRMMVPERRSPERLEYYKAVIFDALRTGQSPAFNHPVEVSICVSGTERRFVLQTVFPIKTEKGYRIGSVLRDITEIKQAEEAYHVLVEHSLQGLTIIQDHRVVFANPMMSAITGYPVEELTSLSQDEMFELIHPDDRSQASEGFSEYNITGELVPSSYAFRLIQKDGSVVWLEAYSTRINYQGKPAIQTAYLDVTERRQAEEELGLYRNHLEELVKQRTAELRAANDQLLVLSRMKDEFVSNVSHELRTPITNLMLREHLLETHPDQVHDHLAVIKRETDRLSRTIEDLLQLSRLDQERIPFSLAPVDLNVLAELYVADRMLIAGDKNLSLSFSGEPDLPEVMADRGLLGQVLGILLTNAINYTPAGGQVSVRTHVQRCGGRQWVGFSVSDTGLGISLEEQPQLFTRFSRGKAGRTSGVPGTGLGLALAKEIVERHRGCIEVVSDGVPGHGTTFTVRMPIEGKDK